MSNLHRSTMVNFKYIHVITNYMNYNRKYCYNKYYPKIMEYFVTIPRQIASNRDKYWNILSKIIVY